MTFSYLILVSVATTLLFINSFCNAGNNIFSEEEIKALAKFRPMVQDILTKDYEKTDTFLIRWLRAKELNIPAAVDMLRVAQKWRKDNRIDGILKENILNFANPPYIVDGFDKEGSPIVTLYPARFDTRRKILAGQESQLVRYYTQYMEKLDVKLRELDRNNTNSITKFISIYDFTNYNRVQHGCLGCFPIYVDWVKHYEKYYPETRKLLVFVNLPRIAVPVVEVVKPVMSRETRKIFHVFGPDRTEWSSFLLKYISKDQLSYQFGGTKKV